MDNNFIKLASIDCQEKILKKGGFSYLSWVWAIDQLMRNDPLANWEYPEIKTYGDTVMVFCKVTAFGKTMQAHLPVLDFKNKAILNPDAYAVNTAMQRCLVKAIALHGLGLYIYAGEDFPESSEPESKSVKIEISGYIANILNAPDKEEKTRSYKSAIAACVERGDLPAANAIKAAVAVKPS